MKLSVSAYRAHAAAHKKILSSYQLNYGSTSASAPTTSSNQPVPSGSATGPLPHQATLRGTYLSEGDDGESQTDVDEEDDEICDNGPMIGQVDDRGGGGGGASVSFGGTVINRGKREVTPHRRKSGGGTDAAADGGAMVLSPMSPPSLQTSREEDEDDSSNADCRSPGQRASLLVQQRSLEAVDDVLDEAACKPAKQSWLNVRAAMAYYHSLRKIKRTKSNQRWMKLRTTVQLSSAISTIQKKPPLKREDSFLKRFSTRQSPGAQETVDDTGSEGPGETPQVPRRRRRVIRHPRSVVNPDENFYFYWLLLQTTCVLYNLWTLIVRQSFPELQELVAAFWSLCDWFSDIAFLLDIAVQLRTGYLEQGLMVYDSRKLAGHYLHSRAFLLDLCALCPLDLLQLRLGPQPMLRFPRFLKVYRAVNYYYMVESRTVWPNLWRVLNLIHILLILAHWFGCFYFLLSEAEGFQGDWVYPHRPGDYATLSRKYLGSLYWSTLTLTTIGDLPTPETNAEYVFTIVSYLIGVFIFATIVGQVGNVITNRNANRLEFERLLDGAKTYMRHHKVPGGMKRRVLRWYDYSWSRGRIQGGGDINTALGLLPDKLKTELALHVNLSVLKKVTIFQECQPEFLHDLVLKMKAYIFTPGDTICRKGEVAREMFIIADGILEVLSETGRVLTTMKAGDFFGEIGILCLDGLNKRTADVRSVGYSELFSLSREDVLAAMKDYPEAQEILQALGRKRLMEVKCSNAHSRKVAAHKASARWHLKSTMGGVLPGADVSALHPDNGSTDSDANTPRRIVDKIKCEAKGLRKVLRKSRTSRRSGDSIELQPLHSSSSSKGVLRRMSRVRSDDFSHPEEGNVNTAAVPIAEPPTHSPLGAGLPLLSRLRLLKEKQDREEIQTLAPSVMQLTPQPEPEAQPEVIGAGLPLLQRLLLLKAKEAREAKESAPAKEVAPKMAPSGQAKEVTLSPTTLPPRIVEELPQAVSPTPPPSRAGVAEPATHSLISAPTAAAVAATKTNIKPWSKLKRAAILSGDTANSLAVPTGAAAATAPVAKISPTLSRVPDIISDNNTSALDKRGKGGASDSDSDCGPASAMENEMQAKFQSLELEVRRRDEIIFQLQARIQELERLSANTNVGATAHPPSATNNIAVVGSTTANRNSVNMESVVTTPMSMPMMLPTAAPHVVLDLESSDNSSSPSDQNSQPCAKFEDKK